MYARSNFSFAGIAVQPAKGTAATITTALPLAGGESIEPQWDIQYSELPDGQWFDVWSVKRGEWAQGDLPVYLHPDLLSTLGGVIALGTDMQPPYVTVLVGIGNRYTKQLTDGRVTGARFSFSRRDLPQVTFTVQGRMATISSSAPASVLALTTPPFVRQETLVLGTVVAGGVQDIADAAFGTSHWANQYIQSIEVNLEFNPIDANELIPFGDIRPIDVMTTVVRVTGNLVMYLPNPVINEIFQIVSGSEFAFGVCFLVELRRLNSLSAGRAQKESKLTPVATRPHLNKSPSTSEVSLRSFLELSMRLTTSRFQVNDALNAN
jgi:hypothetical protein